MKTVFNEKELKILKRSLVGFHHDRMMIGAKEQAELIKRLIQEIDKQEGNRHGTKG